MQIPFFNYPKIYAEEKEAFNEIFQEVCSRGAFIMQKDLSDFEQELAEYIGCKHVIGVADGTVALNLSLKAAGLKKGQEVIISSHTFIATAAAIKDAGGIPVVSDCLSDSSISPKSIENMISEKTAIIMPTQLNGRCCQMDEIQEIADKNKLKIVEDSCQSLGATYKNKKAGLFGVAGSYSFFPAKTLGCFGDGGAIATNSDEAADLILKLRNHGRDPSGYVSEFGINGRLDNLQAAILKHKLKSYDLYINKRREIASLYYSKLNHIGDILLPPAPNNEGENFDIFQNYEIQVKERAKLKEYLLKNGIGTIIQWGGWMIHQFKDLNLKSDHNYAEEMSKRMLLLPMNHYLTLEEVEYICDKILNYYG